MKRIAPIFLPRVHTLAKQVSIRCLYIHYYCEFHRSYYYHSHFLLLLCSLLLILLSLPLWLVLSLSRLMSHTAPLRQAVKSRRVARTVFFPEDQLMSSKGASIVLPPTQITLIMVITHNTNSTKNTNNYGKQIKLTQRTIARILILLQKMIKTMDERKRQGAPDILAAAITPDQLMISCMSKTVRAQVLRSIMQMNHA